MKKKRGLTGEGISENSGEKSKFLPRVLLTVFKVDRIVSEALSDLSNTPTMFRTPSRDELVSTLKDLSRPIAARMRAIFYLRSMPKDTMEGNVEVLCEALKDVRGTALFRHEIAYVLGQMQAGSATPTLLSILADVNDDVVVRHEVSIPGENLT